LGNDGLYEAEVGASLTGSLIGSGNAYFKTRTNGMAAVTYQGGATSASGTNVWGSGDTMGIGASDPTDVSGPVNNTIFLGTNNVWSPANGIDSALGADANTWSTDGASYATLAGYPNYTAIPIAKFTVSFSTRLPAGESATLAGIAGSVGGQGVDIWSEAGANYQQDGSNDLQTPLGAVNPGKFNGFLNTVTFSTAGTDGDFVAATTGASSPVESALAGAATPAAVAASSTGSPAALVQARVAAGRAATRAIAGILEPSSQTQPKGIFQEADLERIAVMLAGQGSDAGTPSGIDPSAVDAALAQLAESGGFTATPNGNQPIAPFSDATDDPFVATDNSILEFFQTYDLSC
jgi:hypothetical protein